MKSLPLFLILALSLNNCLAHDVPELKAVVKMYEGASVQDETHREKFVMALAILRWKLALLNDDGWRDVDAEIRKHPAPPDEQGFTKARAGKWISPRHDYLFRADGTWTMDPDSNDANATQGKWSIKDNQYHEAAADEPGDGEAYTIILLNPVYFIYAQGDTTFYEKRPGNGGLPLRLNK